LIFDSHLIKFIGFKTFELQRKAGGVTTLWQPAYKKGRLFMQKYKLEKDIIDYQPQTFAFLKYSKQST